MAKSRIKNIVEFLSEARDRYSIGLEADQADRRLGEDDNRFYAALPVPDAGTTQWDDMAARMRIAARRPCLTWNRLPVFASQVINDARANKPSIKVAPIKDGTVPTSKFYQDRIRQIEYDCSADIAYDTSADQQTISGRAWIRVCTEWNPGRRNQRLCIEPIENQFSVVDDPSAKLYDRSDADWRFVVSYISRDKHKRLYPDAELSDDADFAAYTADNPAPEWMGLGQNGDLIQVAEYWVKEYAGKGENQTCTVWQYIINGVEILKETKWLDYVIPIFPVWGPQRVVDGQKRTFSLIRNAKDPQRLVNIYVSNIAELIGQLPKAPWIAAIGSVPANQVQDISTANSSPITFINWAAYDEEGRQMPRPERVTGEPPIEALTIGLNQAIDGIKAAMGIFDASLGAKSNETSGIAIQRRQKEADMANFHFTDNQARTRKAIGEALVRLIPKIDKGQDVVAIRAEDGKTQLVPLGTPYKDQKTGEQIQHDLDQGEYGVAISTGPSYTSQRQEAYDRDAALIEADPQLLWVIGDQLFANDDTAGAEERADRMKRAIQMKSPGLIQTPDQQADPQAMQQQLAQLQQQLQVTMAHGQEMHEKLESKQPELEVKRMQIEADTAMKKYVVDQQELTKRTIAEATLSGQMALKQLELEIATVTGHRQQVHEATMKSADMQHQAAMADQQHQGAMESQEAAQEHESVQSEAQREAESAAQEAKEQE